jgi:hypothetical protein
MAAEVDAYFAEIDLADDLRKADKTEEALAVALRNLARVPALITETVAEYGSFDMGSVPPIDAGCTLAAVLEDPQALEQIKAIVVAHAELEPFRQIVAQGYEDLETVRAILSHVAANPGCVQSTLGKTLGIDGRRTSSLIHQLLLAGFITRQEEGRNYALFSSSAGPDPSGSAVSDAHDRPKPGQDPAFVIDAARRIGTAEADLRAAQAEMGGGFQLGDAYWRIVNAESLAAAKRGDWTRTGFLYREMARFLAREGKSYQRMLRQAVWCELLGHRESVPADHVFTVIDCPCSGCKGVPRTLSAAALAAIGGRVGELPPDFPLPHEHCEHGPCPCHLDPPWPRGRA